jgi:hypothetical protein
MIATTISSSISVKPSFFCSFFTNLLLERGAGWPDQLINPPLRHGASCLLDFA